MTDQTTPRHPKRTTAIIIGVLVLVIAGVTATGLLASGSPTAASTTRPPVAGPTTSSQPTSSSQVTEVVQPTPSDTPTPVERTSAPTTAPAPQPTKTATISKPTAVPIKKELTATVIKMDAVTGTADGPGEIGGPSVRFTIKIVNTTGKPFVLSNTVVNAFYGTAATPAVQLRQPGGQDFPASVANDDSATGVFIFNIPTTSRSTVKVTVDTAVQNPVIAFQGSTPR